MSATIGPRFGTVTSKDCSAVSPPGSRAVTVTVASPFAAATIRTESPFASARATSGSDDAAASASGSPSGSLKWAATPIVTESPTSSRRSSIAPTAAGPRFGTETSNICRADRPPGSVAVTVTVAVPRDIARTVTTLPATAAATTPASEDAAP